jgi:hypothetical protein
VGDTSSAATSYAPARGAEAVADSPVVTLREDAGDLGDMRGGLDTSLRDLEEVKDQGAQCRTTVLVPGLVPEVE